MVYIKQKWRQAKVMDVCVKKIPMHFMKFLCKTLLSENGVHRKLQSPHFPNNCIQTITLSYFWYDYPGN